MLLSQGTPKVVPGIRTAGYMGYIPAAASNQVHLKEDDPVRAHRRDMLRSCNSSQNISGYQGYKPTSVFNDRGEPIQHPENSTTNSTHLKSAAYNSPMIYLFYYYYYFFFGIDIEIYSSGLNRAHAIDVKKDHFRGNRLLTDFFSVSGRDGIASAEAFYPKNRPREGVPKM